MLREALHTGLHIGLRIPSFQSLHVPLNIPILFIMLSSFASLTCFSLTHSLTHLLFHSPLSLTHSLARSLNSLVCSTNSLPAGLQRFYLQPEWSSAFEIFAMPLLVTFAVVMLISGLGGPTGYAANPARDLGPRLAHFVLPIPNKGHSEWAYAWVPVLGGLIGGAIAGGLYLWIFGFV